MKENPQSEITHPAGDRALVVGPIADGPVIVDTYLGRSRLTGTGSERNGAWASRFFVEYFEERWEA